MTKEISRTTSAGQQEMTTMATKTKTAIDGGGLTTSDFEFSLKQIFDKYLNQGVRHELDIFMSTLVKRQACAKFLGKFFAQIKELVNVLEPKNFESNLLNALFFDIKWHEHHSRNAALLAELAAFLIDLSSAYTCYIYKCLTMMVKMFTIQTAADQQQAAEKEEIDCEAMYKFSHDIIQHLVKVAPASRAHLVELVDKSFPYLAKDTFVQENYVKNVLVMAGAYKELRLPLMEVCVQRMLKIDVKMTREQIVEAEAEEEEGEETETKSQAMKHPLADRLDAMMHQFLTFIRRQSMRGLVNKTPGFSPGFPEVDWDACKGLYKDLLFIFDNYILCTYGSSHVQFLMFYTCSLRSPLSEGFIDYLWKQFSHATCSIRRQICSYYLGSYLARARYVPITTCVATLQLVVNWILTYIQSVLQQSNNNNAATSNTDLDLHLHRSFYAMCQTLFYVIVFRHHQLFLDTADNPNQKQIHEIVRNWKLNDIVTSKLNPLRFVVPTIRKKFARICCLHEVAFCYPIMDANSRVSLPVSSGGQLVNNFNSFYSMAQWGLKAAKSASVLLDDSSKSSSSSSMASSVNQLVLENPLDSFFPFDPYLLHRSKSLVGSIYQEFNEALYVNNYGDDDEEDEEEESDDGEDEDDGEEMEEDEEAEEELIDADDISDHYE